MKRYLDQLNPKTIIYEVYPITFSIDGVESSLDIIANDTIDDETIKMVFQENNLKAYNTLVYGLMCQTLHLNDDYIEEKTKWGDTYIPGGFVSRKIGYYKHEKYPKQHWDFNEEQFQSFEEILEMIRKRNIKLILVNAPISPSLYASYDNNATFDSLMNTYGEYHNYNEIMHLDDSLYFFDSNHLNQEGVKKFDDQLIHDLFEE